MYSFEEIPMSLQKTEKRPVSQLQTKSHAKRKADTITRKLKKTKRVHEQSLGWAWEERREDGSKVEIRMCSSKMQSQWKEKIFKLFLFKLALIIWIWSKLPLIMPCKSTKPKKQSKVRFKIPICSIVFVQFVPNIEGGLVKKNVQVMRVWTTVFFFR